MTRVSARDCVGVFRWDERQQQMLGRSKWRCSCGQRARVTDDDRIVCRETGRTVGRIPTEPPQCELGHGCDNTFDKYVIHALTGLEIPACSDCAQRLRR